MSPLRRYKPWREHSYVVFRIRIDLKAYPEPAKISKRIRIQANPDLDPTFLSDKKIKV